MVVSTSNMVETVTVRCASRDTLSRSVGQPPLSPAWNWQHALFCQRMLAFLLHWVSWMSAIFLLPV